MKPCSGRVHSIQSLGAVDGPGIRCVVFLQGCPLRCVYCHNPDTWMMSGGMEYTTDELLQTIMRFRNYFGKDGGVTLSGGEPLLQSEFATELLSKLHDAGVHTALDTSGIGMTDDGILDFTDLVLLDIKFLNDADYKRHCGGDFHEVLRFLEVTCKKKIPVWLRHVVVPSMTDAVSDIHALKELSEQYENVEKIELLPFRKLCIPKYETLGIPFPLAEIPEADAKLIRALEHELA